LIDGTFTKPPASDQVGARLVQNNVAISVLTRRINVSFNRGDSSGVQAVIVGTLT
jgi:hypothetical protein